MSGRDWFVEALDSGFDVYWNREMYMVVLVVPI